MSTAVADKPLPSAEQLKAYADQLPEIYRDLLKAFQAADPARNWGEGVLAADMNIRPEFTRHPSRAAFIALDKLEQAGFLSYDDRIGAWLPSPLGEELLSTVTGRRAARFEVPELPKPTW